MVEPQPAKIPTWNTGGTNRTEPTAGEKVTGWTLNDEPPATYFNWLQYYAGAWITWLNERVRKGATEIDLIVSGLQPTAAGAGGDLDVRGGDGLGTDNAGGDVAMEAGVGTGTAGSRASIAVTEPETGGSGSGTYPNLKALYFRADGGTKTISANRHLILQNPAGIDAARGVARLVGKAQPTAPATGDIYLDSGTDRLRYYDGAGYRDGPTLFDPPFYANSDNATDTAQEVAFVKSAAKYLFTIPANYLSAGSLIRYRFECYRQGTSLANDPGLRLRVGAVGSHAAPPTGVLASVVAPTSSFSFGKFSADGEIYIAAGGFSGTGVSSVKYTALAAGSGSWDAADGYIARQTFAINTTIALEIFPTIYWLAVGTGTEFCVATYYSLQVV